MIYDKYRYYYPTRPDNAIPKTDLNYWDNGTMLAQPKINGSNTTIFTNGKELYIMNRHNQPLTNFKIDINELKSLYRLKNNSWLVLNLECLNKSKRNENNEVFNHKLIIFDILVYDSDYLIGKTFEERINLVYDIYGKNECQKNYLYQISDNIYSVKSYDSGFLDLFNELTKIDMVEGLVIKRKNSKLELGLVEKNNHKSQLKCRKSEKNYKF